MANKNLKYTVSADVKGYVEGMDEAAYSTNKTERAIEQMIKESPPLKKALRDASKEAMNLAGAYAMLSKEEKQSAVGQQLAKDLQLAMERAAELQDVFDDTRTGIKNLASDTQTLDALNDGFSAIGSTVASTLGVIGAATGKQEDFNRAIAAYTAVESAANAVTKMKNLLQPQSNMMLAIGRIQTLAAAKAEDIKTAATIRGTIAQKAFNMVAKANPYVLLASAVLAVGAAIASYISLTKDSKKAQEEEAKATEIQKDAMDAYKNTLTESVVPFQKLATEWKGLKTEAEKVQWIKDNKTELDKLGITINDINDAERILTENTQAIVKAFDLRAKAAAKAAVAQSLYTEQIQEEQDMLEKMNEINLKYDKKIAGTKDIVGTSKEQQIEIHNQQRAVELANLAYESKQKRKGLEERINNLIEDQVDLEQRSANILSKLNGTKTDNGNKNNGRNNSQTKEQITRLQELQKEVDKYKKELENLDEFSPNFNIDKNSITKKIKEAELKLKNYKIKIGLITPTSAVDEYKKRLKAEIDKAKEDYALAVINDDTAAQKAAERAAKVAQEKLNSLDIKLNVKTDTDIDGLKTKLSTATKNQDISLDYNFENLSDDQKSEVDTIKNNIDNLNSVKDEIYKKLAEPGIDLSKQQEYIGLLAQTNAQLDEQLHKYEEIAQQNSDGPIANAKKMSESFGAVGSMLNTVSGAFDALGDSEEAQAAKFAVNTAATIANAVSTIAAMNAEALAKGASSAFALPFPACLPAWATVLATITSIFSSLPSFSEGGIVPGGRSLTDNRLAHVASGEMIMNQRQQSNLFKAIDEDRLGNNATKVEVTGVIRGKDLLLVQKYYNSVAMKSGQNIKIN